MTRIVAGAVLHVSFRTLAVSLHLTLQNGSKWWDILLFPFFAPGHLGINFQRSEAESKPLRGCLVDL